MCCHLTTNHPLPRVKGTDIMRTCVVPTDWRREGRVRMKGPQMQQLLQRQRPVAAVVVLTAEQRGGSVQRRVRVVCLVMHCSSSSGRPGGWGRGSTGPPTPGGVAAAALAHLCLCPCTPCPRGSSTTTQPRLAAGQSEDLHPPGTSQTDVTTGCCQSSLGRSESEAGWTHAPRVRGGVALWS